jgi:hypothetical protein
MHNENKTAGIEQVSQDQVEALLKLAYSGLSPDTISSFLGLNSQMVQQVIANDPMLGQERSSQSKRGQRSTDVHSPTD